MGSVTQFIIQLLEANLLHLGLEDLQFMEGMKFEQFVEVISKRTEEDLE